MMSGVVAATRPSDARSISRSQVSLGARHAARPLLLVDAVPLSIP